MNIDNKKDTPSKLLDEEFVSMSDTKPDLPEPAETDLKGPTDGPSLAGVVDPSIDSTPPGRIGQTGRNGEPGWAGIPDPTTDITKVSINATYLYIDSLNHIFPAVEVYDEVVTNGAATNSNAFNFYQIHQLIVPTVFADVDGNYHILRNGKIASLDPEVVSVDEDGLASRVGVDGDTATLKFTAEYPAPGAVDEVIQVISVIVYKLAKLIE